MNYSQFKNELKGLVFGQYDHPTDKIQWDAESVPFPRAVYRKTIGRHLGTVLGKVIYPFINSEVARKIRGTIRNQRLNFKQSFSYSKMTGKDIGP